MSDAPQRHSKTVSEVRNVALDMRGKLDTGELLTGTPSVIEVTTGDLTLSDKALNSAVIIVNNSPVPISQAVQFKVVGGVANTVYTIRITVSTTSTPAQTLIENLHLKVIAD